MNVAKKFFFLFSLLSSAFFLSGCQDVIFANIRKEVKLNDGTVAGSIRALIRFGSGGQEYIYLANGAAVYRKINTGNVADHREGGWVKVCSARNIGNSDYVVTLAADASNLYALTATWEENTSKGQNRWDGRAIYVSKDGGNSWGRVSSFPTSATGTGYDNPALYLFCTNTIASENRQAFFNYAGKGYKLNGTTVTSDANANGASSCAYLNDVEFATPSSIYYGSASCTDEGRSSETSTLYYSRGSTLYWKKSGEVKTTSAGDYIYSLAVTKDYILVGTSSGIKHFYLNADGSVVSKRDDFDTNADAIMSSGYEVNTLLVVDPSKNEVDNAIYSAMDFEGRSQQFDHVCLWAYYPSRGNWNRD